MKFICQNQQKLQAELYSSLADVLHDQDVNVDGAQIGTKITFPSSFMGSAWYQHQLFQDAMATVHQFGKPDLLITFTCNPKWKHLIHSFRINHPPVFGKMCALIYVDEWQKRGPTHTHILGICDAAYKLVQGPEDYDKIMLAEIPDPNIHPVLHSIVTKFMMHGPCGIAHPKSRCMVDGCCSKKFPKDYVKVTYAGLDGYPHYKRRSTGRCVNKSGVFLDNNYDVPYKPYLSMWYNAHINAEICSSVQSCKYLYKYMYKGMGMASVAVETLDKNDEIKKFINSRFITASKCMWRFFVFAA